MFSESGILNLGFMELDIGRDFGFQFPSKLWNSYCLSLTEDHMVMERRNFLPFNFSLFTGPKKNSIV